MQTRLTAVQHCSCTLRSHAHSRQRSGLCARAYGCYVAYMPLVGLETLGFLLQHPLAAPVQHRAVILGDKDRPKEGCVVLDFLPEAPTSPITAAKLLSGQHTQGITRIRKLGRFLSGTGIRTEWAGPVHQCRPSDRLLDDVRHFNTTWDHQLHLREHNCVHYAESLLSFLQKAPSSDDSHVSSLQVSSAAELR